MSRAPDYWQGWGAAVVDTLTSWPVLVVVCGWGGWYSAGGWPLSWSPIPGKWTIQFFKGMIGATIVWFIPITIFSVYWITSYDKRQLNKILPGKQMRMRR